MIITTSELDSKTLEVAQKITKKYPYIVLSKFTDKDRDVTFRYYKGILSVIYLEIHIGLKYEQRFGYLVVIKMIYRAVNNAKYEEFKTEIPINELEEEFEKLLQNEVNEDSHITFKQLLLL